MKKYYTLIIIISFSVISPKAAEFNDSLLKRIQINLGTTGFTLANYDDFNITGKNRSPIWPYYMKLSYASIDVICNDKISCQIGYSGFRTIPYNYPKSQFTYDILYKTLDMHVYFVGISRFYINRISKNVELESKISGQLVYRFGKEQLNSRDNFNLFLFRSPGAKLGISEEVILKKRIVIGINEAVHLFYQPKSQLTLNKHIYLISSALYLGLKF